MESISKVKIGAEVLGRLCSQSLNVPLVESQEIPDGWFNTIHLLSLADGTRAVLKVAPPSTFEAMRYERGILATEVDVHRRLAAEGLKVPKILVDCPDGGELGHAWFVMEHVQGQAWSKLRSALPQEAQNRVDAQIARQGARINAITGTRFGRWLADSTASDRWATSFEAMMGDLMADAEHRNVMLPCSELQVRSWLANSRAALDEVKVPSLVLWDSHDGNIMVRGDRLELTGFLDTDRALWGDPLMEFAHRFFSNASQAWKDSYAAERQTLGLPELETGSGSGRRKALYDLYLCLVQVIEVAYRGFGPEHDQWARGLLDRAWHQLQAS